MAGRERRQQQLLATLIVILAAIIVYRVWARPSTGASSTSNARAAAAARRRTGRSQVTAPDVRLRRLDADRPRPVEGERNLFRFKPKAAPAPPPRPVQSGAPAQAPSSAPGVAQPAPIALKFIGIVDTPGSSKKIAVLSDGRNVYHGTEGDIIEGRYRILHIGTESIEMAYLDGRGRQTIRLSGS